MIGNNKNEYDAQQTLLIIIVALTPCFMMGVYVFGLDMLDNMLGGCGLAVLISWIMWKFGTVTKNREPEYLAAVITGALIVFGMPSTTPIWIVFTGVAVAMIPVNFLIDWVQRTDNIFNGSANQLAGLIEKAVISAAAAQAALWVLFREEMNTWPLNDFVETRVTPGDVATGMTPLGILADGGDLPGLSRMFVGFISGPCGEVSVAAAIIGGVYLIWKKIISPVVPLCVLITIFAAAFVYYMAAGDAALYGEAQEDAMASAASVFGTSGTAVTDVLISLYMALYQLLAGGAVFGAFFLAPAIRLTPAASTSSKAIIAVGVGIITMALRIRGIFTEGMALPVLIMYVVVLVVAAVMRKRGKAGHENDDHAYQPEKSSSADRAEPEK